MVSWTSAGSVSGYDPITRKYKKAMFVLPIASGPAVDLNGSTRLNWDLQADYPGRSNYPTLLEAEAPLTFTSGDFSANPGRVMGGAAVLVKASKFAAGVIPTNQQIFDNSTLSLADIGSVYRTNAGNVKPTFYFTNAQLDPNTKYWLLVYPAAINKPANAWSKTNYRPVGNVNTTGRAVSVWTNRTPKAPIIAAPPGGGIFNPGATYSLNYTPQDPDAVTPNDADRSNMDLAGVEFQFARLPSSAGDQVAEEEWTWLSYRDASGSMTVSAMALNGPVGYNAQAPIRNLQLPIFCAGNLSDVPNSTARIPAGDWQIRARTVDFGHAYPNIVNPLGLKTGSGLAPRLFPSGNISPWSAPVKISIPTQVPAPIPASPTNSRAVVAGLPITLQWNYRNTYLPPYPQKDRWIQVRKVGDANWSTVAAGPSSQNSIVLPFEIVNSPTPVPSQFFNDINFEAGSTGGWVAQVNNGSGFVTVGTANAVNLNVAGNAQSGSRYLQLNNTTPAATGAPYLVRRLSIDRNQWDQYQVELWHRPPNNATGMQTFQVFFTDAAGNTIFSGNIDDRTYETQTDIPAIAGVYTKRVSRNLIAPANATGIIITVSSTDFTGNVQTGDRIDTTSMIGTNRFETVTFFRFQASTQYEWRVRVADASNAESDWSLPARFWVVPAADSGPERPVPEDTIEGATLGCGKHRVFVYRRGGLIPVGEITDMTHIGWGRLRDDISSARIVVSGWGVDCGNLLAKLQTWAYEIVIFRDNGYSPERVWEGPITLLTYKQDSVEIDAKDVVAYLYRRILRQEMNDRGVGDSVVNRAARVVRNGFAPDDPNILQYLQILFNENDANQYRNTPAYSRTCFEEIDDMAANAGLDYTAVGRSILLWGTRSRIGTLPEMTDRELGAAPIVSEYGMQMSNRYAISDGNGIYGTADRLDANGVDPNYGLVEMLSSTWASDTDPEEGTYTQEDVDRVADSFAGMSERSIADRFPPPVVVRVPDNTTLNPNTVLSIQHLVPGVAIPIRATGTLRKVVGTQKLDSVTVTEIEGEEKITVTMSPFNSDDAASGGETE